MKPSRKLQTVACVRCGVRHESIRTYSVCSSCLYDLRYNHCTGCGGTLPSRLFTDYDITMLFSTVLLSTSSSSSSSSFVSLPSSFVLPFSLTSTPDPQRYPTYNTPAFPVSIDEALQIITDIWNTSILQNIALRVENRVWHSRCLFRFTNEWETFFRQTIQYTTYRETNNDKKGNYPLSSARNTRNGLSALSPSPDVFGPIDTSVTDTYGHMVTVDDEDDNENEPREPHPGAKYPSAAPSSFLRAKVIHDYLYHDELRKYHNASFTRGSPSTGSNDISNTTISYPIPFVASLLETMDKPLIDSLLPIRGNTNPSSSASSSSSSTVHSLFSSSPSTYTILPSSTAVYLDHPDAPPQSPFKSYSLEHLLLRAQSMGLVKERPYRFKSYKQTLIGKDLVNFCLYTNQCLTREEATKLGQAMLDTKLLLPIQPNSSTSNSNDNSNVSGSSNNLLSSSNSSNSTTPYTTTNSTNIFEDKDTLYSVSFRKRASARDAVLSHVSYTQAAYESALYNPTSSLVSSRKERSNTLGSSSNGYVYPQTEKTTKTRRLTAATLSSPLPIVRVITVDANMNGNTNNIPSDSLSDTMNNGTSTTHTNYPSSWELRLAGATFTNHTLTIDNEASHILYPVTDTSTMNPSTTTDNNIPVTIRSTNNDEENDNNEDDDKDGSVQGNRNERKSSSESLKSTENEPFATVSSQLQIQDLDVIIEENGTDTNNRTGKNTSSSASPKPPPRFPFPPPSSVQKRYSGSSVTGNLNNNTINTPDRRSSFLSTASTVSTLSTTKPRNNSIEIMTVSSTMNSNTKPPLPGPLLPPPSTLKTNITTTAARIVSGAVMSIFKRSNLGSRVGIDTRTDVPPKTSNPSSDDDEEVNKDNNTVSTKKKNNTVRKLAFTTATNEEGNGEEEIGTEDNGNNTVPSSDSNKQNRKKKKGKDSSSSNDKTDVFLPTNDKDSDNDEDDQRKDDRTKDTKKKSLRNILVSEDPAAGNSKLSLLTGGTYPSSSLLTMTTTNTKNSLTNSRSTKSTTVGNDYDGLGLGSDLDDDDVPPSVRNNVPLALNNGNASATANVFSTTALNLMTNSSSSSVSGSAASSSNIFSLLIQPSVWREQRIKIASLRKDLLQRTWKTGWLVKQGHVRKNWKKRWFILQGYHLSYSKKGPIVVNTSTTILNDNNNNVSSSSSTAVASLTPTKKSKETLNSGTSSSSSSTTTPSGTKVNNQSTSTKNGSGNGSMTTVITKAIEIHNDQEIIPAGILDIRDYTLEKAIIPRSSLCMRLCAKRVMDHEYYIYAETETEFVTWVKALSSAMRAWEDIDRSIAALQLAKSAALAAAATADFER